MMDASPNDAAVVRSVIELGRELGIAVVAEGVETESHLQTLRQLGCTVVQGYHIGYPMSASEFEDMATQWNARAPLAAGTVPVGHRRALKAV
jgi:EAL domain-containing protein (putative c-di-GMP-specific phosphodiesterase class I)